MMLLFLSQNIDLLKVDLIKENVLFLSLVFFFFTFFFSKVNYENNNINAIRILFSKRKKLLF